MSRQSSRAPALRPCSLPASRHHRSGISPSAPAVAHVARSRSAQVEPMPQQQLCKRPERTLRSGVAGVSHLCNAGPCVLCSVGGAKMRPGCETHHRCEGELSNPSLLQGRGRRQCLHGLSSGQCPKLTHMQPLRHISHPTGVLDWQPCSTVCSGVSEGLLPLQKSGVQSLLAGSRPWELASMRPLHVRVQPLSTIARRGGGDYFDIT